MYRTEVCSLYSCTLPFRWLAWQRMLGFDAGVHNTAAFSLLVMGLGLVGCFVQCTDVI
jgi:hypothetical protein